MGNLSKRIEQLEGDRKRGECVVCRIGREVSEGAVIECKHRPDYSYADALRDLDAQLEEEARELRA